MNREIPILFSTPMVQAILDGRKTMTRRVIKPQPCKEALSFNKFIHSEDCGWEARFSNDISNAVCDRKLKYDIGDILWVRETWCKNGETYLYKAGCPHLQDNMWIKWRPSIHMPREAARIFLRVTNVRVERIQEITAQDAKEEGIHEPYIASETGYETEMRGQFRDLWDSLNAKRGYGWDSNPWVWVYEFERISKAEALLKESEVEHDG